MAPDSPNLQLDTVEGRLWLQLEWRALAAALIERGSAAQTEAIRDALAFRSHRHEQFPGSAQTEASLEIAEGVPEYTGTMAGEPDRDAARWRTIGKLSNPDQTITFVRSFAYTSGPPYGLLLDERLPGWRRKLSVKSDLSALLASTLSAHAPVSAEARAPLYGAAAIRIAETERAQKLETTKARYRARLVERTHTAIAGRAKICLQLQPECAGFFGGHQYGLSHVSCNLRMGHARCDRWHAGAHGFQWGDSGGTQRHSRSAYEGPGWTLDLAPGWSVVPGARADSYTVAKM